jgi:hypothetical protein
MVANPDAADAATAAGFENIELAVGVVERVEERAVGRDAEPGHHRLALHRAKQR